MCMCHRYIVACTNWSVFHVLMLCLMSKVWVKGEETSVEVVLTAVFKIPSWLQTLR